MHTWAFVHFARLMAEFEDSVKREPPIPFGAPLNFVPGAAPTDTSADATGPPA
jgi:arylsulfatase